MEISTPPISWSFPTTALSSLILASRFAEENTTCPWDSHGFNSGAQKAASGGNSDRSRALPELDNAAGYEGVSRTLNLNITRPQATYIDVPTSHYEPEGFLGPPSSPQ
jgi:hypothetical protein